MSSETIHYQYMLPWKELPCQLQFPEQAKMFREQDDVRNSIATIAMRYHGYTAMQYRGPQYGCNPESGFDCSGFVLHVLRSVKENFPRLALPDGMRHSDEMFHHLGMTVHESLACRGDLVFYTYRGDAVRHVGIYLGKAIDNRPYMIHSSGRDGRFVEIIRIANEKIVPNKDFAFALYTHNPVGFKTVMIARENHVR